MLWFDYILGLNFISLCFKLIIIHYHTQQREIKFILRIKLNHNIHNNLPVDRTQPHFNLIFHTKIKCLGYVNAKPERLSCRHKIYSGLVWTPDHTATKGGTEIDRIYPNFVRRSTSARRSLAVLLLLGKIQRHGRQRKRQKNNRF